MITTQGRPLYQTGTTLDTPRTGRTRITTQGRPLHQTGTTLDTPRTGRTRITTAGETTTSNWYDPGYTPHWTYKDYDTGETTTSNWYDPGYTPHWTYKDYHCRRDHYIKLVRPRIHPTLDVQGLPLQWRPLHQTGTTLDTPRIGRTRITTQGRPLHQTGTTLDTPHTGRTRITTAGETIISNWYDSRYTPHWTYKDYHCRGDHYIKLVRPRIHPTLDVQGLPLQGRPLYQTGTTLDTPRIGRTRITTQVRPLHQTGTTLDTPRIGRTRITTSGETTTSNWYDPGYTPHWTYKDYHCREHHYIKLVRPRIHTTLDVQGLPLQGRPLHQTGTTLDTPHTGRTRITTAGETTTSNWYDPGYTPHWTYKDYHCRGDHYIKLVRPWIHPTLDVQGLPLQGRPLHQTGTTLDTPHTGRTRITTAGDTTISNWYDPGYTPHWTYKDYHCRGDHYIKLVRPWIHPTLDVQGLPLQGTPLYQTGTTQDTHHTGRTRITTAGETTTSNWYDPGYTPHWTYKDYHCRGHHYIKLVRPRIHTTLDVEGLPLQGRPLHQTGTTQDTHHTGRTRITTQGRPLHQTGTTLDTPHTGRTRITTAGDTTISNWYDPGYTPHWTYKDYHCRGDHYIKLVRPWIHPTLDVQGLPLQGTPLYQTGTTQDTHHTGRTRITTAGETTTSNWYDPGYTPH